MMNNVKHKKNGQIRFETQIERSSLYNHSDAYILVSRTITITG